MGGNGFGETFTTRGEITNSKYVSLPVTVASLSKACIVFGLWKAGIVGSNPTQGMAVQCLCVCVFLCLDRGVNGRFISK
jgi:hypothetical protein